MSGLNSDKTILVPLVGAHFRPPAKQVLAHLPAGAKLTLVPEPGNPYDPKAIKVLVLVGAEIPENQHQSLRSALAGTGTELEELLESEGLQLGFIADSDGKMCQKEGCAGNREVGEMAQGPEGWDGLEVRLSFDSAGRPAVAVERRG